MKSFVLMAALLGAASAPAFSSVITSVPSGGTTTAFPGGNTCFLGPSSGTVGAFPVTATNNACYNDDNPYHFYANGDWLMSVVGDNSGVTVITFNLMGDYASIGGFMNYAPGYGTPIIAALDSSMNLLESYDLSVAAPISTPGGNNAGAFRGISRPTADIRYFEISGSRIAIHDLTTAGAEAPEPGTFVLIGAGGIALAWRRKRR
jgi:PEP-CTERM motif-containing protein